MDPTNPSYYGHDQAVIECIEYIQSHAFDFLEGNIIKYVTRYEQKGGVEDLKKAKWYLERLIKREEGKAKPYDSSLYKEEPYDSSLYKAVLQSQDVSNDNNHLECGSSEELDASSWSTCDT